MANALPERSPENATQPPVTLKTAYRFFFPLILMTELNAVSKSIIHAFLARSPSPSTTLAGFNVSFTFYYSMSSATEVSQLLTLSYLKHRACLPRLIRFFVLLAAPPVLIAQVVAFTRLGDWIYGTLFGASAAAVAQARHATFILSLSAPILLARALGFGILILHRRTLFITLGTGVRVLSLAGSLVLLPRFLNGAAAGAGALTLCMLAETLVTWIFAWPIFRRMPASGALPAYREMWRFAWPLMLNQSSEMGMVFVINVLLGRLLHPDLALAAFGVVHGLVSLIFSPVRNLVQTAQTLVRTGPDARLLGGFTRHLVILFTAVAAALFWSPASEHVLGGVMGIPPALEAYCRPAMQLAALMAVFWAFSALYRGLLAGSRDTRVLALTGPVRGVVAGAIAAVSLVGPDINGAVLGLIAWMAGYACECALLRGRAGRVHEPAPRPRVGL